MAEPAKEDTPVQAVEPEVEEEDEVDDGPEQVSQLGFAEEPYEDENLEDRLFPSKIGGRPVWLDYINLPESGSLRCGKCNQPMMHLLQMYMPVETVDDAYHRMLYVFCCRDGGCHGDAGKSFKILRCQLPPENSLYSEDATDECDLIQDPDTVLKPNARALLCAVCGCKADKRCSRCKGPAYCGKEHQAAHWSDPDDPHQKKCVEGSQSSWKQNEFRSPLLFEEYEVTTDTEPSRDREKEEKQGKLLLKQYQKMEKRRAKKGIKDEYEYDDSFGTATKEINIDPQFEKFELRVSRQPQQVVRFDGAPTPLWATSSNQPSADLHEIPTCENCGAKRQFELQIMPQLLFYLKSNDDVKNSIEFGTLALYTCAASCSSKKSNEPYLTEFVWRQPPV